MKSAFAMEMGSNNNWKLSLFTGVYHTVCSKSEIKKITFEGTVTKVRKVDVFVVHKNERN